MATSRVAHLAVRRRSSRQRARRRWAVGVLLVGGAILVGGFWPRLQLQASPNALAQVVVRGWGTRVVHAAIEEGAGSSQPLRVMGGSLWPRQPLPSGRLVRVQVEAAGLLGWPTRRVWTVRTPAVPRVVSQDVRVDVGQPPIAAFSAPVAQARWAATGQVRGAVGHTRVPLGPSVMSPNRRGVVALQVRARRWEQWGPVLRVHWASVPWLTVTAASRAAGQENWSTAPIAVTFSAPVRRANTAHWTMAPAVPGRWYRKTDRTWEFQPTGAGWAPDTTIHIGFPAGTEGPRAEDGAFLLPSARAVSVQLPQGMTLRLQEWLAQLGYLPVRWLPPAVPGRSSGWASVYQPPTGQFSWRYAQIPAALRALWNPTYWTAMTQAAVIAFQHAQHLPVNGIPGPAVWTALQRAVADHAVTTTPYAYVYVSETLPERLWLWVGGHLVLSTLANTGIPQTPTLLGSYAVDERQVFQVMRGTNPNGTPYADPVHWINYFDKSQAVHGFLRAHYGYPQSLGCVEVPIPMAQQIYPHLYIGALVTVAPPGSGPLVPPASGSRS